jgi:hypothetical protein
MKYKLLGPHVLASGERLEEGTEVGDDTDFPWKDVEGKEMEPTTQMEGLDEASRKKVRDVHQRLYGQGPAWERGQSDAVRQAREREAEEQRKLDEGSEPVSMQQKAEREWERDHKEGKRGEAAMAPSVPPRAPVTTPPGAARQPSHTSTASPTRGGSTTPSPGPATPKAPDKDDVRPTKPNEEQYPKG